MLEKKPVKLRGSRVGDRGSAGYRRKLSKVIRNDTASVRLQGSPLGRSGAQGIGFLLPYGTATVKIQDTSSPRKFPPAGFSINPLSAFDPGRLLV